MRQRATLSSFMLAGIALALGRRSAPAHSHIQCSDRLFSNPAVAEDGRDPRSHTARSASAILSLDAIDRARCRLASNRRSATRSGGQLALVSGRRQSSSKVSTIWSARLVGRMDIVARSLYDLSMAEHRQGALEDFQRCQRKGTAGQRELRRHIVDPRDRKRGENRRLLSAKHSSAMAGFGSRFQSSSTAKPWPNSWPITYRSARPTRGLNGSWCSIPAH
jgi:hypothetical protein